MFSTGIAGHIILLDKTIETACYFVFLSNLFLLPYSHVYFCCYFIRLELQLKRET
jgi:hypothetical protein